MSTPRSYVTDSFHPLNRIQNQQQYLYIRHSALVISSIWCTRRVFVVRCVFDNCACARAETLFPRVRAIVQILLLSIPVRAGAYAQKQTAFTHARLLSKRKIVVSIEFYMFKFQFIYLFPFPSFKLLVCEYTFYRRRKQKAILKEQPEQNASLDNSVNSLLWA